MCAHPRLILHIDCCHSLQCWWLGAVYWSVLSCLSPLLLLLSCLPTIHKLILIHVFQLFFSHLTHAHPSSSSSSSSSSLSLSLSLSFPSAYQSESGDPVLQLLALRVAAKHAVQQPASDAIIGASSTVLQRFADVRMPVPQSIVCFPLVSCFWST